MTKFIFKLGSTWLVCSRSFPKEFYKYKRACGCLIDSARMASSSAVRVTLKRNNKSIEMKVSQVTSTNLKRTFQVDPCEVWLLDEVDDQAYFPDANGLFTGLSDLQTLVVEGPDDLSRGFSSSSISTVSSISPMGNLPRTPNFRSVIAAKSKKQQTVRVKVLKAIMTWDGTKKPLFQTLQQLYIELQDTTANVASIENEVKEQWGANYNLVTSDGLKLGDSPATQGL
jgi:hypothetical protein